uniref:Uncharacterized protein n=1 Tax=Glossina palpalis gambiensis TaxID=67801 RepID=A0A1B0C7C9_9MUSC
MRWLSCLGLVKAYVQIDSATKAVERNATKNLANFQLLNSGPILLFSSVDNLAVAKSKRAQAQLEGSQKIK